MEGLMVSAYSGRGVIQSIIVKLCTLMGDKFKLQKDVRYSIDGLRLELTLMNRVLEDRADMDALSSVAVMDWLKELMENIEDCIDELHKPVGIKEFFRNMIKKVKTSRALHDFAVEIHDLSARICVVNNWRERYSILVNDYAPVKVEPNSSSSTPYPVMVDLECMEERTQELLELLEEAPRNCLRVISIVGFHGLGKTTLAMEVYHNLDSKRFSCRAWVDASKYKDGNGILMEILRVVVESTGQANSIAAEPIEDLRAYLERKERFFIVIERIQPEIWETIKYAFPDRVSDGRIIVITSINSVAVKCSSHARYVYRMQALDDVRSKTLFKKTVFKFPRKCANNLEDHILKKCSGVPLAIIGVAQLLIAKSNEMSWNGNEDDTKEQVYLSSNPAIERMTQILTHSYQSLPNNLKIFFLHLSIFPEGHLIKTKSLVRRWSAIRFQGHFEGEYQGNDNLRELVDRNLITPVEISNNGNVKACKIHGIIFDFIVHYSNKEAVFTALIHNGILLQHSQHVRFLSFHSTNAESAQIVKGIDLSCLYSLSIFNHVQGDGDDLVDLQRCKLIRVLHLENCQGLKVGFIDGICELLELVYLSLRGTDVRKLPTKISKLHRLKTLDIRGTEVDILPIEVLSLPELSHLLGRFKLPKVRRYSTSHKLQRFFSRSKLKTLAGIIMDDSSVFELIMAHCCRLRKIKIWSDRTPNSQLTGILTSFFRGCDFGGGANASLTIGIDFGNQSIDFLDNLEIHELNTLISIKLKGSMTRLPSFIPSLHQLVELCLSSTCLRCEDLSVLQYLHWLRYLKLVVEEFSGDSFSVKHNGFPDLRRLWMEAPKIPRVSIENGGMPLLTSLKLISEDVEGLPVASINELTYLTEIILGNVNDQTRRAWEDEAKRHINRPMVESAAR